MLATHPKRRWPFVSKAVSMSCTLGLLVYTYCAQSERHRPAAVMVVAATLAVLRPCGTGVLEAHRPFCYAMRPCEGRRAKTQGRPIDETASDKGCVNMGAMGVLNTQKFRTFCVAPMNFEIPNTTGTPTNFHGTSGTHGFKFLTHPLSEPPLGTFSMFTASKVLSRRLE